jgi:hypothetical protein
MSEVFLELVLRSDGGESVSDRHDLEEILEDELAGLAEISGGGSGMGRANVDIDVRDEESVLRVVEVVRRVCVREGCSAGAKIVRHKPQRREWML